MGLVAEACRDYERREPVNRAPEPRQSVTRQNSGGSLGGHARLPPPYQSPPGPPPPYQPPPLNATTSPQRQVNKQPSPQVILGLLHVARMVSWNNLTFSFCQHSNMLPNARGFPDSGPQEPVTSTPKRPQQPGPRYSAPPPYPVGPRPDLGPRITAPAPRQPQGELTNRTL